MAHAAVRWMAIYMLAFGYGAGTAPVRADCYDDPSQ